MGGVSSSARLQLSGSAPGSTMALPQKICTAVPGGAARAPRLKF